jgi:L-ascorbate metabolism protein UlaG (beta-lactamase superfamily)
MARCHGLKLSPRRRTKQKRARARLSCAKLGVPEFRERAMAAHAILLRLSIFAAALGLTCFAATAQSTPAPAKPEMTEACPGLVAADRPAAMPVAFGSPALAPDEARLTYVGHATFLIESPKRVRIATDYNDYVRPPVLPDIATMNHAHATHYSDHPDADIKFVLRGWRDDGKPANHDVTFADVHVRSVSTNIRDWRGGTERNGNSIFIFEVGSLCIAHLGHLHHTLTQQQLDDIGHVDVLLVPVDGAFTMDMEGMLEVVKAIKAPLMVPMHFFSAFTLREFLDRAGRQFEVEYAETPSVVLAKTTLPRQPKFLVLPGH